MRKLFLILIAFGFVAALGLAVYPASDALAKRVKRPKAKTAKKVVNKKGKEKCRRENHFRTLGTEALDVWLTKGKRFPANALVNIYVVENTAIVWAEGVSLTDVSGGAETVLTDTLGRIPCTLIWARPLVETVPPKLGYDVVIDVNRSGDYNVGVDIVVGGKKGGVGANNTFRVED